MKRGSSQKGSALILGSIAVFMLMSAIFMVLHIGTGTAKKMQLQNAADAAALAGAQVLANSLSTIAWINNGMSLVHYNLVLYSRELTTRAMYAAFQDGVGIMGSDPDAFDVNAVDAPVLAYNGGNPKQAFDDLNAKYVGTPAHPGLLPKAQLFVKSLARIERAIAMMTPIMVDKEVHRIAAENGAERVAFFPGFTMFPDPDGYFKLDIIRKPAVGELQQWIIRESPDTAIQPFEVTAEPHHDGGEIQKTIDGRTGWDVSIEQNGGDTDYVTITAPPLPHEPSQTTPQNGDDLYRIDINNGESSATIKYPMTIIGGSGSVEYLDDGTMVITDVNGRVTRIRIEDNGMWVNGVFHENQEGTNLGGADVNVTNELELQVGDMTVRRNNVSIGRVTFWFDPFRIDIHFPAGWAQVYLDRTVVNGLSTLNPDSRWRLTGRNGADRRDTRDRTRHRLTEIDTGQWLYEWKKDEAYLQVDSLRFAYQHFITESGGIKHLVPWIAVNTEDREGLLETFPGLVLEDEDSEAWKKRWFNPLTGAHAKYLGNHDRYFLEFECKYPGNGAPHPTTTCPNCGMYQKDDGKYYMLTNPSHAASRSGENASAVVDSWDGFELKKIPFLSDDYSTYASVYNRPLKVTAELFKFGITVATWGAGDKVDSINAETSFLTDIIGQRPTPDWGYFAVSGARVGVFVKELGGYGFRFDTPENRDAWVASSGANLYQPKWQALLYPVRLMIRSEDIDANTSIVEIVDEDTGDTTGEFQVDSGLNFLFRALSQTGWRSHYSGTGNAAGTRLGSMRSPYSADVFNLSGDELEDVLHH